MCTDCNTYNKLLTLIKNTTFAEQVFDLIKSQLFLFMTRGHNWNWIELACVLTINSKLQDNINIINRNYATGQKNGTSHSIPPRQSIWWLQITQRQQLAIQMNGTKLEKTRKFKQLQITLNEIVICTRAYNRRNTENLLEEVGWSVLKKEYNKLFEPKTN